jgi:hypothetical protein
MHISRGRARVSLAELVHHGLWTLPGVDQPRGQQATEDADQSNKHSKLGDKIEDSRAGDGNRTRMTSLEGVWRLAVTMAELGGSLFPDDRS